MSFQVSGWVSNSSSDRHPQEFGIVGGVLLIHGSQKSDVIALSKVGNQIKVFANLGGVKTTEFHSFASVKSIKVLGKGGDDKITNNTVKLSRLYGGNGNDTLRGGSKNDFLFGDAGDDVLFGKSGNDSLRGGTGNDKLIGDVGNDKLYGDAGNDHLLGGAGNDELFGGSGNDRLEGSSGNDRLDGAAGTDNLYGGAGHDELVSGSGNDFAYGGTGDDAIYGNDGVDRLYGEAGQDFIKGGNGNDYLRGGSQDDQLMGEAGHDSHLGDSGNDEIRAGSGNDFLFGGDGNDQLFGDAGNDLARGQVGADVVRGGDGNDTLEADDLNVYDSFADQVFGEAGDDLIYGTFSLDSLNGGGQAADRERMRFFVDSTADTNDGNFTDGQLTLRESVANANDDDIITFRKLTASSAKVINLVNGEMVLNQDVTLEGVGAASRLTLDGSGNGARLFTLDGAASVEMSNLTIRNFDSENSNGGVFVLESGNLTLTNIVAHGNNGFNGGVAYLNGNDTSLHIELSTLMSNTASNTSACFYNVEGALTIDRTTLDNNQATLSGGALITVGGSTRISNSTLSNNQAGTAGGAIKHINGALSIVNSTLSGNQSIQGGAAIDAGLHATSTLLITHSTIVFNTANANGGGLVVDGANEGIINNSIIVGNKNGATDADFWFAPGVNETQSFNNWIGVATATTFINGTNGNHVGALTGLDATLSNNGGPTKTHKLNAGSGAINAGNNAKAVDWLNATLAFDQTGKTRKVGGTVDIGAFEFQS